MGFVLLWLFVGFLLGVGVYHLAASHVKQLERLEREEYMECVRLILLECVGCELEYTRVLAEYMNDLTKTLHDLPPALEAIVRRVTNEWEG